MTSENRFSRPALLNEHGAAAYIGLSVAFLRAARCRGLSDRTPSPPYLKLGRAVRYDRADLDAWLDARRVASRVTE